MKLHRRNSFQLALALTALALNLSVAPLAHADGFFDDVESGANGWTASGLWHIVNNPDACGNSFSATHSWYYGTNTTCNYDTGVGNSGDLISPPFVVPANATMTFQSWEQTEGSGSDWDKRVLYISTDNDTNWVEIFQSANNAAAWHQVSIDFLDYAGTTAQLRFHFETGDAIENGHRGWYIDDVLVATTPPAAPSGLQATAVATNQVDLSWTDNANNEEGFKIERAPDATGRPGTWAPVVTLDANVTSYSDTGVTTNTTYWYRVRAFNAAGDSLNSHPVSVTVALPDAPSNLTATTTAAEQIDLAWTDNSNNEDGFKIERSTDGTNFTQIAQVLPDTKNYRNTSLFPNAGYFYRVRAFNRVGDSEFSNIASASTVVVCSPSVSGWGYNYYGQARGPSGLTGVVAIAGGGYHSLALKSDGTVVGWGYNYYGQTNVPSGLTGVAAIAGGSYHSLALKSDGTVVGWGYNGYGQTTPPTGLTGVVAVAGGYYQSLALKSDGTVAGWGYYYYAEPPEGLSGVVAIAAGNSHNLALKSDGTVVGWGNNGDGQISVPSGLTGVVAIAGGSYHSLALKSDGTVVGWGSYYGTPPAGLSNVVAIAAGNYHSLALKSDGTVVGWGNNGDGQISVPNGLTGVIAIGGGVYHSLALTVHPVAASALNTKVAATNQVDLSWMDNANNEDGFKIERAADTGSSPGTWTQIAVVGANVTNYSDMAVGANTNYWYRVRAYNSCNESPWITARSLWDILDDFWSGGVRTNQDLPSSSAWWVSSDVNLSAAISNMTLTVASSSVMAMTYFTADSSSPAVWLNIGDTLTATFKFLFGGVPTVGSSSQGFRIGLVNFADSTLNPKHVTADGFSSGSQGNGVQGYSLFGKTYTKFSDTTPIDIRKRTNLSGGSLLGTSSDWTTLAKDFLNTNAFGGFANLTPYSLQFILQRTGLNTMAITVTWSNMATGATLSDSTVDSAATNFSFDGIAFRPQNNSQAPATNIFKEVRIELTSAPVGPSITTQPQDQTVYDGQNATFSVVASGTMPLRYQWYYNTNSPLANATNSTLTLTGVQFADAGGYSVVVSNAYGSLTSAIARLTVSATAPWIAAQPQDLTVYPGQTAAFSVDARGSEPKSYQWYYNTNSPLSFATNVTLTLTNVQPGDAGSYSVIVSNAGGSVISSNAILTVTSIPIPPSGLSATAVSRSEIDLSWTDNSGNEEGFKVDRAPDSGGAPGAWTQIATVSSNVTHCADPTLSLRTKYWYRVRAYNSTGDSVYSNPANATTFGSDLAFPGAEGFGAYAVGGRSGTVYHVTHLGDSGPGSLRDGVSGPNRTIVFDVSGTIDLASNLFISVSNLTIAGQTAPGDGITLKGWLTSVQNTHDVIVRYIRCRPGDINCPDFQEDAFHVFNSVNVIVDHISASWSIDETLSTTWSTNVTVQWSMIAESLECSCHLEGCHGYGSLLRYGTGGLSYHHNLYAHNRSRNPRLGDNLRLDFVNNVIYNWGDTCGYNGADGADNPDGFTNYLNYVNNYLIVGPDTTQNPPRAFKSDSSIDPSSAQIYQSGNLIDTNRNGVFDALDEGWSSFTGHFTTNAYRFTFPRVDADEAATAYLRVLSSVGASVVRDSVDSRIVSNVMTETGAIINSQDAVGGWPTLESLPAPADTDQDGMPDFWEEAIGLNPNDPADRNTPSPDGYTRLEEYLSWLTVPHARVQTNYVAYVDLRRYTAGLQNPTYAVFSPANGTVALFSDGYTAQFTPTAGFSGLASFLFTATGAQGSLTGVVSVVVTLTPFQQWQQNHFGCINCSQATETADPDGDGQNNLFEYTAGLDPTNAASLFVLRIETVDGQPDQKNLIFKPWVTGRTYTTQFTTDLVATAYATLPGIGGPTTNGTEVTVTDLNAVEPPKFYRIKISLP